MGIGMDRTNSLFYGRNDIRERAGAVSVEYRNIIQRNTGIVTKKILYNLGKSLGKTKEVHGGHPQEDARSGSPRDSPSFEAFSRALPQVESRHVINETTSTPHAHRTMRVEPN